MAHRTVIIGSGLTGLVAGSLLAARGHDVEVLERAATPGGRARSTDHHATTLNLGAHALYARGEARRLLDALAIPWSGKRPPLGALGIGADTDAPLPLTPWAWATTPLLDAPQRAELARFMLRLGASPVPWEGRPTTELLDTVSPPVARVLRPLIHVSTYASDLHRLDAAATLRQLRLATSSVFYVDGGWQRLVDGAVAALEARGGTLRTGVRVDRVEPGVVHTAQGTVEADAVLICGSPTEAARLNASVHLDRVAERAHPVRAAALDLVLREVPDPARRFALGLDTPTYASVHSDTAHLGAHHVVHALCYLGEAGPADPRTELEALLDRLQPGWRDQVLHARFLPRLTVTHAIPDGSAPGPVVPDLPGVLVAGDWVGGRGMLLDRALASAEDAVHAILGAVREAA